VSWDARRVGPVAGTALIGKALRLVDTIGAAPGAVGVRELLAATGWSRPTLYRILSALVSEGYVRRDPALRGYVLGYRILDLAQNAWARSDLVTVASLELQRLRNLTGETAYLATPHREGVLSLGKAESPHSVRSAARLGVLKPYHCTSQGKAILAHWEASEVDQRIGRGPYERYTEATIVDRDRLDEHLGEVRNRGFAIEDQEILAGTRCVGAPILDRAGRPVGAISVAGPAWRLTLERAFQLGPELADVAQAISKNLRSIQPARQGLAAASIVAGQGEPAFYGADPWWDAGHAVLRWTDRLGQAVHATGAETDDIVRVPPPSPITCSVAAGDGALVFVQGETWRVSGQDACRLDAPALAHVAASCGSADGTVWLAARHGEASVVGPLSGTVIAEHWTIPARVGALCCSADGHLVRAADPERGVVYEVRRGRQQPRVLSRIPAASGQPRALALDDDGGLWVALYDGWAVVRLDESGEFAETIPVPVPRPTGLAFGGPGNRTLFVTTARVGLDRTALDTAPMSGSVLAVTRDAALAG
jgi:IclR family acetate operon transcriptional repressor